MANYTVASGVSSYASILVASQADQVTFADRYGYASITNTATSGVIYATSNGAVPTDSAAESGSVEIAPGETVELANGIGVWSQVQTVIPRGVIQVGNGAAYNASTNPSTMTNPGTVTPMSSLAGGSTFSADPGLVIGLLSTGTPTYEIQAAG
jgi:hypothetical protein